jgi:hypothetical protein
MNEAQKKIALEIIQEAQEELQTSFDLENFKTIFDVSGSTSDQKRKGIYKALDQVVENSIRK